METAANKLQTGGLSYGRFAHWQMSLHLNKALLAAAEAGGDQSLSLGVQSWGSRRASTPCRCP